MLPPKQLGRFFLVVLLVYAVLMAPWPGLQRGYAYLFRAGGNAFFSHSFWFSAGKVRFLDLHSSDLVADFNAVIPGKLPPGFEPPGLQGVKDTLMVLMNRRVPASIGQLRTSSRYVGYGPTAVLIALVVATSLPWSRRGWALLWGWLLIQVFIAFRLTLTLTANGFAAEKDYALFHPNDFWRGVLTRVESIFSDDPTVSFVVPAVVWLLVALRTSGGSSHRRKRGVLSKKES